MNLLLKYALGVSIALSVVSCGPNPQPAPQQALTSAKGQLPGWTSGKADVRAVTATSAAGNLVTLASGTVDQSGAFNLSFANDATVAPALYEVKPEYFQFETLLKAANLPDAQCSGGLNAVSFKTTGFVTLGIKKTDGSTEDDSTLGLSFSSAPGTMSYDADAYGYIYVDRDVQLSGSATCNASIAWGSSSGPKVPFQGTLKVSSTLVKGWNLQHVKAHGDATVDSGKRLTSGAFTITLDNGDSSVVPQWSSVQLISTSVPAPAAPAALMQLFSR